MPCFVILASVCGPPAAALGLPWPTGSLQQPVSYIMSIKGIHQELGGSLRFSVGPTTKWQKGELFVIISQSESFKKRTLPTDHVSK